MLVGAHFSGPQHEYRTSKAGRDSWGSDCNRGDLSPDRRLDTVSDRPTDDGTACLGRCTWSASRFLRDRRLCPDETDSHFVGSMKVPRLQILTAAQILDNRRPQVPFGFTEGFKKAEREKSGSGQGELL
jgi:hypothetical protein